jgi:hypothetical protein
MVGLLLVCLMALIRAGLDLKIRAFLIPVKRPEGKDFSLDQAANCPQNERKRS